MRHINIMLASAAAWISCATPSGNARAQPIPDPAQPPAILDPAARTEEPLRGSLSPEGGRSQAGATAIDVNATADLAGDIVAVDGRPLRVREIETLQAGVDAQDRSSAPNDRGARADERPAGPEFVGERRRGELEPIGLRAGTFIVYPQIETGIRVTDNVFSTSSSHRSDVLAFVRPNITARSDWARHELVLTYEGEYGAYAEFSSENPENTALAASGRVDVNAITALSAEAAFAREMEGRGSPEVSDEATSPTVRQFYGIVGTAARRFTRVTAALRGGVEVEDYEDGLTAAGAVIDNSDRDQTETLVGGRVALEVSGSTTIHGDGEYRWRDHDRATDNDGFARDARRVSAVAGASFQPRAPIRAEIEIGFVHENLEDSRLASLDELVVNAAASWAATPITTLSGGYETEIEATTIVGASASVARRLNAGIDIELRRNLVVRSALAHEWMDYPGAALEEETTNASLDGELWVSRQVALVAGYAHERQTTNDGTGAVSENVYTLGLRVQR